MVRSLKRRSVVSEENFRNPKVRHSEFGLLLAAVRLSNLPAGTWARRSGSDFGFHHPPAPALHTLSTTSRSPLLSRQSDRNAHCRPFNGGSTDFLEGKGEADAFHDGETEVGFVARRILDLAVGFVNAHQLGALLLGFFCGSHVLV